MKNLRDIVKENVNNFNYPLTIKDEILNFSKESLLDYYNKTLGRLNDVMKRLVVMRVVLKKKGMINHEDENEKEVINRMENELYVNKDEMIKKVIEDCLDDRTLDDYLMEGKELGLNDIISIENLY